MERTDPGDGEHQPDGKRGLRSNAINPKLSMTPIPVSRSWLSYRNGAKFRCDAQHILAAWVFVLVSPDWKASLSFGRGADANYPVTAR
jgi:hypothetical protein